MAFIDPLLARLFGKHSEDPEPQQDERDPLPEPPPPPPKFHPTFQPPPEHALSRLWNLHCGGPSAPALTLEGPGGEEVLPEDIARQEVVRLRALLNTVAKKRLERAKPVTNDKDEKVLPNLDVEPVVFLTKDKLTAWLLVLPPVGEGEALTPERIHGAMEDASVSFGLDWPLLDSLPSRRDRYFHLFLAARGQPPEHGADGKVVELFPRVVEKQAKPDENNRIDYTSLTFFHNIDKGGVICRAVMPTKGVPGRSVRDEEIPAKDGKAAALIKGRNTEVTEDGAALVATISGQVEFSGRSFQVKPLLEIQGNVDFSTGNINFLGDVYIHGDVCSGFTVRARGNITVEGVVEACSIEAGEDLVVVRGVQGDNQAVIRAQRNVFAKYLENCCVCVKESLHSDCIINCDVYCDGLVEARSGRMTIIGGSIRAASEVSAGTIGSRAETKTEIILGGLPCGDFDFGLLTKEVKEAEEEMEKLERQPESPQKLSRMGKLRVNLLVARKKLELLAKEKEAEPQEEDSEPGLRRMDCDMVYPNTCLTIDGVFYQFERQTYPCTATLAEGEIRLI